MPGWAKLFASIVHSTIWREPDHVRLVWITMLAISDKDGNVEASIPGLADASRVSLANCIDAIEKLKETDKYSRSKEHDGRRIKDIDGGWLILNYVKHRGKLAKEKIREQTRERVAKHRNKKDVTQNVTRNADVTPFNAHADADADADKNYSAIFEKFWKAYPNKKGKRGAYKVWNRLKKELPSIDVILAAILAQSKTKQWAEGYIPHPSKWLNQGMWEDETDPTPTTGATIQSPYEAL